MCRKIQINCYTAVWLIRIVQYSWLAWTISWLCLPLLTWVLQHGLQTPQQFLSPISAPPQRSHSGKVRIKYQWKYEKREWGYVWGVGYVMVVMYMFMSHNIHLNIHMLRHRWDCYFHVYLIMCAFYHVSLYGHALLTRKTVYVLCNLSNLKIALCILRILGLRFNLEIVQITHAHYSWYRRRLANCSTKDERWQDSGDRRQLARHQLSDVLHSLTREWGRWSCVWSGGAPNTGWRIYVYHTKCEVGIWENGAFMA